MFNHPSVPAMTFSRTLSRSTRGFSDIHDLTADIQDCIAASAVSNGIVAVNVPGSTASITTIEFEAGVLDDLQNAIERLIPRTLPYRHDSRWGDGNGFAHVRAAILGPSVCLPIHYGKLGVGTWQQVVLIDFDNRPRKREIGVQIVGD
jgi:secondary thiamine-phosphate synthase enzyme